MPATLKSVRSAVLVHEMVCCFWSKAHPLHPPPFRSATALTGSPHDRLRRRPHQASASSTTTRGASGVRMRLNNHHQTWRLFLGLVLLGDREHGLRNRMKLRLTVDGKWKLLRKQYRPVLAIRDPPLRCSREHTRRQKSRKWRQRVMRRRPEANVFRSIYRVPVFLCPSCSLF